MSLTIKDLATGTLDTGWREVTLADLVEVAESMGGKVRTIVFDGKRGPCLVIPLGTPDRPPTLSEQERERRRVFQPLLEEGQ
jgi:hypothetical protein